MTDVLTLVVVALVDEQPDGKTTRLFIDPATRAETTLTPEEEASAFFVRF